ncbi:SpoIIE domain-containing protein [Butyrivibrio proteoclasticus B316]|uniref:SpoIIE domain-containing protein n=1 Tax=Butyrivibrio proteoclasticus (strain ATCC 51982 / DSM 14932 / B316) TaxID=515622 RepID=E0S0D0_BUTPB|nr:PP2C family protein-serine/threonine phosphatase [Butyrivibrio proteoclasticus]ADL35617.1 SpoIIE domain-containing protein [Butyrivibrio proteoclasticus B316]
MEFIGKKQKRQIIIVSIIYLTMIFLCVQFLYLKGIHNLLPIYVFNISGDIFGMAVGYLVFACCIIDVQKNGSDLKYLLYLLNAAYVGLFADAIAWLVDGDPNLIPINMIDNTIYYMCAPAEAYCFWLYTMNYLGINKGIIQKAGKVLRVGFFIAIGLRIINLFTGIYFTIGPDGVYHRSPLYPISLIFAFLTLISALIAVWIEKKHLQLYQVVVFFIYAFAPLIVGVMTLAVYGLSLSAGVIMLVILLMYGVLNVAQGRDKVVADRDLTLASAIQENVLPKTFPYLPERKEFDLFATMTPAKEVGGDFYDFFMLDDDHLTLVMADVSGKGIPAALFMMVSRTLIRNRMLMGESPGKALESVNEQLCEGNKAELFVTVWLAVISLSTGEGIAVNAGHEHPVLRRKDGEYEIVAYKHSPAVATIEGIRFREHEFKLNPGDSLFVYTDGVPEATNEDNELFGTTRMLEALNANPDARPEALLEDIKASIDKFVGDAKQFDDITMLGMHYFGP